MGPLRAAEELVAPIIPSVAVSTWLMVLARGRMVLVALVATEFFLTLAFATALLVLSLRFGLEDGVVVKCSFC